MITDQLHLPFTTAAERVTLAHPLDAFYAETGATLPPIERIEGDLMPQPWRQLLVHTDDMTPTLEAYYGQNIHIRVLGRRRQGDEYCREVVLHLDGNEQPVEFGANRIRLNRFPEEARRLILEEHEPLGHILRDFQVRHTCEPNAFLRLPADALIKQALGLNGTEPTLYGRHNRLFDPEGRLISEVVEILGPPSKSAP
jgi:chorismate-pyruvate lyase